MMLRQRDCEASQLEPSATHKELFDTTHRRIRIG
jgi:hypothetical protein